MMIADDPEALHSPGSKGISVIVCTHNGSRTITRTLAALQAQTGLEGVPYEVILVDNASTDNSAAQAAKSWQLASVDFRILNERRLGLSFARHTGYSHARHGFLCWVDDDNFLAPNYLSYGMELIRRYPGAAVCGGCGQPLLLGETPGWFSAHKAAFALGPQGEEEGPISESRGFVYGGGAIFRRQSLDELGRHGFPGLLSGRKGTELSAGEDVEVCYALRLLGWQILQSRNLLFQHAIPPERLTWEYCERLFHGFGRADVVLMLYRLYLKPMTLKRRVQRLLPKLDLRKRIRRATLKDLREGVRGSAGTCELLRRQVAQGRTEEACRLDSSRELWNYLALVQKFAENARPLLGKRRRTFPEGGRPADASG